MGWVILLGLVAVTAAALWRWGGLPRAAREPVAAALLLGIAGYVWQGRPALGGQPAAAAARPSVDEEAITQRKAMSERFGSAGAWLVAADAAMRMGWTQSAVTYVKSGLREDPDNADLWVGLGNALVMHGGGIISPAAIFAFQRAAQIDPAHAGPPFFMGLAYAQSGRFDQARAVWSALLARSPKDAPWREDLELRLAMLPR